MRDEDRTNEPGAAGYENAHGKTVGGTYHKCSARELFRADIEDLPCYVAPMPSLGRLPATLRVALSAVLLVAHARRYDFLCDDAFLSLRYARNLAAGDGLVYNLGERVEGFSSVLWVVLEAIALRLGASPRLAVDLLGVATAVGAAASIEWAADRLGLRPVGRVVAHASVASSVSFAAWVLGGLEASAFGVLLLATLVTVHRSISGDPPWRHGAISAGLVAAAAMLLRPETLLVVASAAFGALVIARGRAGFPLARAGVTFATIVAPLVLARRLYFDDWFPNAFYLSTTGGSAALLDRGIRYLAYAAKHHGSLLGFGIAGALVLLRSERTRVFGLSSLLCLLLYGAHVARVGGDGLPATRLVAPLVPLLALLAGFVVQELGRSVPASLPAAFHRGARGIVAGVVASIILAPQLEWARRVTTDREPEEYVLDVEPLRWTRLHAQRSSALGSWIAGQARPGDAMATGAAGAAPYFAGPSVSNLDLHGRCDRYVARQGTVVGRGAEPRRRSPLAYTLSKRPVFLFEGDYDCDESPSISRDPDWERLGYTWAAARIDAERDGAPSSFWWVFLLRRDRADELRGSSDVVLPTDDLNHR
jgi:hypothetical protein